MVWDCMKSWQRQNQEHFNQKWCVRFRHNVRLRFGVWFLVAVTFVLCGGCDSGSKATLDSGSTAQAERSKPISFRNQYRSFMRTRNYAAAERLLLDRMIKRPEDLDAFLLAARLSALQDHGDVIDERFTAAIDVATKAAPDRVDAIVQEWTLERCRLGDVMLAIDQLRSRPERSVILTRLLGQLLTIVGDVRGARQQYETLLSSPMIQSDEVYQVACEVKRPHRKPEIVSAAIRRYPDDLRPKLAEAVNHYEGGNEDDAIEVLKEIASHHADYFPATGRLAELLAENGRKDELRSVLKNVGKAAWSHPSLWYACGTIDLGLDRNEEAVVCFAKATQLDPLNHLYAAKLAEAMRPVDAPELALNASKMASRLQGLRLGCRAFSLDNTGSQEKCFAIASSLHSLGFRSLADRWVDMGKTLSNDPVDDLPKLLARLSRRPPTASTSDSVMRELGKQFDLTIPRPSWLGDAGPEVARSNETGGDADVSKLRSAIVTGKVTQKPIEFRDESADRGLDFQYDHGEVDGELGRRVYHTTGGGIGIADFDLDGWEDVYLTQGSREFSDSTSADGGDPVNRNGADALRSDQLFWNRDGTFVRFPNAATPAAFGYGQGVSAGDVNGDGFPDLFVANFGANELWINRGDGTFVAQPLTNGGVESGGGAETGLAPSVDEEFGRWTSSVAIADVNGDGNADLLEINYCDARESVSKTCRDRDGKASSCVPIEYAASSDRLWINRGDGRFEEDESWADVEQPGRGLGLLVANLDDEPDLEVFISNDMSSNHFWKRQSNGGWSEQALLRGVAVGASGRPQACMGIAFADLNGDQQLDFLVTNYSGESNAVYQQTRPGFFADRSKAQSMDTLSFPMLSFGTATADFNHDGIQDLFIANGLVTRAEQGQDPFRQPAQVLSWGAESRWRDASPRGEYFDSPHTGRSVAMTDVNRDGMPDLVVGNLGEPTRLLISKGEPGNKLEFQLIGTTGHRSAIGATVTVQTNLATRTLNRVGGDGYFATHTTVMGCTLLPDETPEEVSAQWLSGKSLTFPYESTFGSSSWVLVEDGTKWRASL